jgi:hypothetical protein
MENPLPVTDAALTVTGAVPDEVRSTDCVDGEFRLTLPNETVVEASVSPGTPADRLMVNVFATPPA